MMLRITRQPLPLSKLSFLGERCFASSPWCCPSRIPERNLWGTSGTAFHGPDSPTVTKLSVKAPRKLTPAIGLLVQFLAVVLKEGLLLPFSMGHANAVGSASIESSFSSWEIMALCATQLFRAFGGSQKQKC